MLSAEEKEKIIAFNDMKINEVEKPKKNNLLFLGFVIIGFSLIIYDRIS